MPRDGGTMHRSVPGCVTQLEPQGNGCQLACHDGRLCLNSWQPGITSSPPGLIEQVVANDSGVILVRNTCDCVDAVGDGVDVVL